MRQSHDHSFGRFSFEFVHAKAVSTPCRPQRRHSSIAIMIHSRRSRPMESTRTRVAMVSSSGPCIWALAMDGDRVAFELEFVDELRAGSAGRGWPCSAGHGELRPRPAMSCDRPWGCVHLRDAMLSMHGWKRTKHIADANSMKLMEKCKELVE